MSASALDVRASMAGVFQIVRYNWPFYAAAALGIVTAALILSTMRLPAWVTWSISISAAAAAWWGAASLLASYWVYDRSGLMHWSWLAERFGKPPRQWLNIHAGLDESSTALATMFPHCDGIVLDIFDSSEMTEGSINRARPSNAAPPCSFRSLPLGDEHSDAVFLLFAAHELRRRSSRAAFFRELKRVLKPGGRLILVEHLRDLPNFLAYGPGFLHFFSRREWRRLGRFVGLLLESEAPYTPFVRCFIWRKEVTRC